MELFRQTKMKLIKPAWYDTLGFLAGRLEEDKATELVRELSKHYFQTKKQYALNDYNPHLDDLCLAGECAKENSYLIASLIHNKIPIFENIMGEFKKYIPLCIPDRGISSKDGTLLALLLKHGLRFDNMKNLLGNLAPPEEIEHIFHKSRPGYFINIRPKAIHDLIQFIQSNINRSYDPPKEGYFQNLSDLFNAWVNHKSEIESFLEMGVKKQISSLREELLSPETRDKKSVYDTIKTIHQGTKPITY